MRDRQAPGSPSPLWGGARGGGIPGPRGSAIPPTLSLPHKGGGDAAARSVSSSRVGEPGDRLSPSIRTVNLVLLILALASAFALYVLKYDTRRMEVRVQALERSLDK